MPMARMTIQSGGAAGAAAGFGGVVGVVFSVETGAF